MSRTLKSALAEFPRFSLLEGPTPIQRLAQLDAGGARLWVKRDDLMGVGGGGNKLRKLEFLVGEALAQGCDTFITTGGLQSNHARQSAAAAARAALACELMLTDIVPRHDADYRANGNLLLDDLFGATVHRLPGHADALAAGRAKAEALARDGRKAYVVGSGGSSPRGCLGYADCAAEIIDQEREAGLRFDTIIVPNGSSGTHAGLAAGMVAANDDPRRLLSFTVLAPLDRAASETRRLTTETLRLIQSNAALPHDAIAVDGSELGEAYGVPTNAMLDALRTMARSAGLLLDPVYSGKAFAGALAHMRSGAWRDRDILFVMTGGVPGLFAYREAITTTH